MFSTSFPFQPASEEMLREGEKVRARHAIYQKELTERLANRNMDPEYLNSHSTSSSYFSGDYCEKMGLGGVKLEDEPD